MDQQIELLIEIVRWRGVERLLIVLGGFASVILGGLLYRWGVFDKIKAEIDAGNVGKFSLQDASPGILFCLFGVILLVFGINNAASVKTSDGMSVESVIAQKIEGVPAAGVSDNPGKKGLSIQFSRDEEQSLRAFLETNFVGSEPPSATEWTNLKKQAKSHLHVVQKGFTE